MPPTVALIPCAFSVLPNYPEDEIKGRDMKHGSKLFASSRPSRPGGQEEEGRVAAGSGPAATHLRKKVPSFLVPRTPLLDLQCGTSACRSSATNVLIEISRRRSRESAFKMTEKEFRFILQRDPSSVSSLSSSPQRTRAVILSQALTVALNG